MSKNGKGKWEIEYENLRTKNIDEEIKKLEESLKTGVKGKTPKEYRKNKLELEKGQNKEIEQTKKEIEKLKNIKTNMPQIERIVVLRNIEKKKLDELVNAKKEFDVEIESRNKLNIRAKEIEQEFENLQAAQKKIRESMRDPNLTDEEIAKLRQEEKDIDTKLTENSKQFKINQFDLKQKLKKPLPKVDFDKKIQARKNMISKCNYICKNLMAGKQMEEISAYLDNWQDKRYTDKANEMKEKKENTTKKQNTTKQKESKDLVKVSEFDEKHPRLAKIKNFFKHPIKTIKDSFANKKVKVEEKAGKMSKEDIANRKKEFYERLTEKGKLSNLPEKSGLAKALAEQDKVATHGVRPRNTDNEKEI